MKAHSILIAALLMAASALHAKDATFKSTVTDPENNSVMETIADSNGRIIKKTLFYLDENKREKSAIHYDTKGSVRYKEVFKRDASGILLVTWLYSANDKVLGRRAFTYNPDGTASDIQDFDADGRPIAKAVPAARASDSRKKSRGRPDKKR